jgi:hypothetical protein
MKYTLKTRSLTGTQKVNNALQVIPFKAITIDIQKAIAHL